MYEIDFTELPELVNDKFYPLLVNKNRYLVLVGGGGSGKSVFAAQKVIYRTLAEDKHRILVVRKVAKTLRESCFILIRQIISDWGLSQLFNVNKTDMKITCINGNEILFAGLDDVEKLKSIANITSIWIEEASELEPEDFRQLDIRLRGKTKHYKQIVLSFNPVSITHWLKAEFFDKQRLNTTTMHSTYKDNKFLDDEAKAVLEAFKDTDPYYYMVYCCGEWGVLGKTIFDAKKVTERITQLRNQKPLREGFFVYDYVNEKIVDSSIKWVDEPGGYIRIYKDVEQLKPYVVGGDTAGDGSDNFVGQVLDNVTGEQVATLQHQTDEDLYARQMYCLGKYYNNALLSIEINFSTYPVKELKRLGYHKQFIREIEDNISKKKKRAYGFQTNKLTRPLVISNLVQLVREHTNIFYDIPTLEEMLTFVRNESGKAEAQQGKHDDLIMGLAIAHYSRDQQKTALLEKQELEFADDVSEEDQKKIKTNIEFVDKYKALQKHLVK